MARNPLAIIRGHIGFFEETLKQSEQAGEPPERIAELQGKLSLLRMIETDMEIEYFELGDKTTVERLSPGAVFATEYGVYAVKSEYRYGEEPYQCQCVLLASGEYAHFKNGDQTIVYEVILPRTDREEEQG